VESGENGPGNPIRHVERAGEASFAWKYVINFPEDSFCPLDTSLDQPVGPWARPGWPRPAGGWWGRAAPGFGQKGRPHWPENVMQLSVLVLCCQHVAGKLNFDVSLSVRVAFLLDASRSTRAHPRQFDCQLFIRQHYAPALCTNRYKSFITHECDMICLTIEQIFSRVERDCARARRTRPGRWQPLRDPNAYRGSRQAQR
jgi:hypothetical protein